jgi:hypothetical protein
MKDKKLIIRLTGLESESAAGALHSQWLRVCNGKQSAAVKRTEKKIRAAIDKANPYPFNKGEK